MSWYLHRSGAFSVLFCSILVLIYAALFTLAGVSILIHECVVVHKRMGRWDRGGISLLNRSEMYGANGLMCGLVRALYFTQIVGDAGAHYWVSLSLGAASAVWKNPKYLHPELHFNVLVVDADLTGMHRSDISLRVIGALFQYLEYFRNF